MADTALRIEHRDRVVILENQDPPRNRLTFEYMDALEHAIVAIRVDPGVRAVVITAAGDEHFSVGMDLKQLISGSDARGGFEAVLDQRLRVLSMIEQLDRSRASSASTISQLRAATPTKPEAGSGGKRLRGAGQGRTLAALELCTRHSARCTLISSFHGSGVGHSLQDDVGAAAGDHAVR